MPGWPGWEMLGCAGALQPLGPGRVAGRLVDLGAWPGLVEGEAGEVHGQVAHILDPAILSRLDAFEDYDPDNEGQSLYLRRPARLIGAKPVRQADLYLYRGAWDPAMLVAGGCWRRHIQARPSGSNPSPSSIRG